MLRRPCTLLLPCLALAGGATACATDAVAPVEVAQGARTPIRVQANVAAASVAGLTAQVTGPGIPTPITRNLALANGLASATLVVPAGSDRVFTLRAFDGQGVETHRGARTVPVTEGQNATLSLTLRALTGGAPIDATLGTYTVTIAPASGASVAPGNSLQFTATVTDADGVVVPNPTLTWASANPAVASVSASGVATGRVAGTTGVFVSYEGIAATAPLSVR